MKRLISSVMAIALAFGMLTMAPAFGDDDGWQPLFNGEDLSGWQGVNGHMDDWHVEDGELVLDGRSDGAAAWIGTEKQYSNYELELEYKLYEGGNSGVFIRTPLVPGASRAGIEIQLLDDYADIHADLHNWQYSGSVYGVKGPSERATKQPGQWQTMRIYLNNGRCVITKNDVEIVNVNFDDHLDQADQFQGLVRRIGHIGLQNYGDPMRVRYIKVRELD